MKGGKPNGAGLGDQLRNAIGGPKSILSKKNRSLYKNKWSYKDRDAYSHNTNMHLKEESQDKESVRSAYGNSHKGFYSDKHIRKPKEWLVKFVDFPIVHEVESYKYWNLENRQKTVSLCCNCVII